MDDKLKISICETAASMINARFLFLHLEQDELTNEAFVHLDKENEDEARKQAYLYLLRYATKHRQWTRPDERCRACKSSIDTELEIDLINAINAMDELSKNIIYLIFYASLSKDIVARILNCQIQTLNRRLSTIKNHLYDELVT
jgi:DNA-directed RNA polymerase specialized sigma subunit